MVVIPACKRNFQLSFIEDERKVKMLNKYGVNALMDKLIAWINQIRMGNSVTGHMKICSLHFKEDFFTQMYFPKEESLLLYLHASNAAVNERIILRKLIVEPVTTSATNDDMITIEDFRVVSMKHSARDAECARTLLD